MNYILNSNNISPKNNEKPVFLYFLTQKTIKNAPNSSYLFGK